MKHIVQDGEKQYNGKVYQPGDVIECTAAEAKQMRLSMSPHDENSSPLPPSEGGELSPAGGGAGGEKKGKKGQ